MRDAAHKLSHGEEALRVCVIDTRGEIYLRELFSDGIADVMHGYPRAKGMEIAARTMSAQLIVCDEIGSDAEEVRQCMGCGVKLAVTVHAAGIDELRSRPGIAELCPLFDRAALLEGGRIADIREIRS